MGVFFFGVVFYFYQIGGVLGDFLCFGNDCVDVFVVVVYVVVLEEIQFGVGFGEQVYGVLVGQYFQDVGQDVGC